MHKNLHKHLQTYEYKLHHTNKQTPTYMHKHIHIQTCNAIPWYAHLLSAANCGPPTNRVRKSQLLQRKCLASRHRCHHCPTLKWYGTKIALRNSVLGPVRFSFSLVRILRLRARLTIRLKVRILLRLSIGLRLRVIIRLRLSIRFRLRLSILRLSIRLRLRIRLGCRLRSVWCGPGPGDNCASVSYRRQMPGFCLWLIVIG